MRKEPKIKYQDELVSVWKKSKIKKDRNLEFVVIFLINLKTSPLILL